MNEIREQAARRSDEPEPGLYKSRLVRGGPWVAAQVWHDPSTALWHVKINGQHAGESPDPWEIDWLRNRYFYALRIDQIEHDYLVSLSVWAVENDPNHPAAQPSQPIRLGSLPPIF